MAFSSPNNPLFGSEQDFDINHIITCDNASIAALGFSSFSIVEMDEWIRTGDNKDFFNMPSGSVDYFLDPLDGHDFAYWRNSGRNGEYIDFDDTLGSGMSWSYDSYNTSDLGFSGGNPIEELVAMNDQIVSLLRDDPTGSGWTTQDQARMELLRDIKSSKSRSVSWDAGIIVDNVYQSIPLKLYLFDDSLKKNSARSVTLSDLKIVAPRVDNNGRVYLNKEDGELTAVEDVDIPHNNIATSISLSYNELTGKWESGTPQVLARLTTDISGASGVTLTELMDNPTTDLLDPFTGQGVNTGSAIPIRMQNANPLQWSPEYKVAETGVRTNDKTQVRVYNVSERNWASGEMVVLNKIDGVWLPLPFGTESTSAVTITPDNGDWEFTNLSATVESYFRSSNGDSFRYDEYEQAFHKAYYDGDSLNDLYPDADTSYLDVIDTFAQFTSWDMMGTNVGGLRAQNGLATTQFAEKANGDALGDNGDGKYVAGVHSSHFFGCVFPDGYDAEDKYNEYMTTTHPILYGQGTNFADFFVDIPATTRVFTPNSDANADPAAGEMFTGDSSLRHFPADIATNASPSGVNGRPMLDIRSLALGSGNLASYTDTFLANHAASHWLCRGSDSYDSAYDLKPSNPSRVQFRPLKVEAYAAFEHDNYTSASTVPNNTKGEFGGRAWDFVDSNDYPISSGLINRLDSFNLGIGVSGLRYSTEIAENLRSDNAKYPNTYWDLWADDRPAGAIGVIGAVSTATAESSIRFNADCFLGMKSWFINGSFYPSWGGNGGNGPHNSNTTMLYARVYHHWDRNLTVYDPRFFAVHHFNIGFDRLGTTDLLSVDNPIPTDSSGPLSVGDTVDSSSNLLDYDQWDVNKERRGKLLPYKYEYRTIGVGQFQTAASGTGYTTSDTFTTSGGNGDGVILNPTVNGLGEVTGFTAVDLGKGFLDVDFTVAPFVTSDVRIVPLEVTGTGYDGYFLNGIVKLQSGEDTKPEIATTDELLQLTPNPPLGNDGDVVNEMDELRSVEAQLTNKSSDNKYDIFYHFHNDISHTFADSWATPAAFEQAVTLEVVPL